MRVSQYNLSALPLPVRKGFAFPICATPIASGEAEPRRDVDNLLGGKAKPDRTGGG